LPPHINGSIIFARWCQCASPCNTCFLGHIWVHNPNGISIGSASFAQLIAQCHRACPGMSFPLKIATLHGAIWTSHLICNSFSPFEPITQMAYWLVQLFCTAHRRCVPILYNGPLASPLKIAPSHGGSGPHLIHGSLSPPEPTTQTASRSIQPFLQGPQL